MTRRDRSAGYALVAVLWLVTLLTVMTASYHASARMEAKMLAQTLYRAQAQGLAEAGIWLAISHWDRAGGEPPDDAIIEFDGTAIEVTVRSTAGRINLNRARSELLESLLAQTELSAADRTALVEAILDWRDTDDTSRPNGAEDQDYARAGAGYGAKDGLFATLDELRYVRGMTDTVFRRIAPMLTLHGNHTRVYARAAPREVLLALPGATEAEVAAFLRERGVGAPRAGARANGFDRRFLESASGNVYFVTASASQGGQTARVTATLRYPRRGSAPPQVLAWDTVGQRGASLSD